MRLKAWACPTLSISSACPESLHICHCYLQIPGLKSEKTHFNILYATMLRIPLIHIKISVFFLLHNTTEDIQGQMCKEFFLKQKNRKRKKGRTDLCLWIWKMEMKCVSWPPQGLVSPVDQYDHVIRAQTLYCDMTPLRDRPIYLSWHIVTI